MHHSNPGGNENGSCYTSFTYLSSSLPSLLNMARFLRFLTGCVSQKAWGFNSLIYLSIIFFCLWSILLPAYCNFSLSWSTAFNLYCISMSSACCCTVCWPHPPAAPLDLLIEDAMVLISSPPSTVFCSSTFLMRPPSAGLSLI